MVQTELPLTIGFLMRNRVLIESKSFCVFWTYWNYVWSTMSIQFSMLTAIDRYLFIFHQAFLLKYKVLCHYLPMICIWLYLPCLHMYFIIFFPYGNTTFDYSKEWCGGPQFEYIAFYVTYDTLFDTFAPMAIIILFNLIIITKVVFLKKVTANVVSKWKKNRRMILQLMGICLSQLIGGLPYCIISLGVIFSTPTFALDSYTQVFIYIFYVPSLASPLFAFVTMPKEVRDKITVIFICWEKQQRAVLVGETFATGVGSLKRNQVRPVNIGQNTATAEE